MFKPSTMTRSLLLAFGGSLALLGTGVFAQEAQRVEITGSSIKRIDAEGALPVQVINRAEIQRSGATSVSELIQALPAIQGFTQSSQAVGGGGGGFSGASIHNVGETRTLVLLNGRRVATWAGQTLTGAGAGIDLNSIPLAAVERVEVLTDGASALYGTDAVAGVVNFILRKDLSTGEAAVSHYVPRGSVGQTTNLSLSKGFGDLNKDGFNVLLAASFDRQKQLKATDREFAKTGVIPFSLNGTNYIFFNGSIRGVPANYEIYDSSAPDPDTAYDVLGNPYYNTNSKCPTAHVFRGGACRYDYTTTIEIQPEQQRDSLFASVAKRLGGDHTLSLDLAYNKFKLTSRIAPPPVDMLIPTGSSLYNKYMPGGTNVLDATSVYGYDLYAYWRGVDVGNRITEDVTTAKHGSLGLTGTLGAWDYSSALTYSTNKWVESHLGGWLKQNEQDAAIAAGTFDPFLEPGQQSAAGKAALAGMQNRGVYKSETSSLTALELRGSRELFKLEGRSVQLGIGADLRRENVKYEPSAIAQGTTNNIAGDSAQERPFDVSRNVWGAFAEVVLPITKSFELSGAIRHDDYSDFGATDNIKTSFRFQPSREFMLRGSFGTGFRAPAVPQVAAGRQLYGVSNNTYNCPDAAKAALIASDAALKCRTDGSQYEVIASGNGGLQPEKSQQWMLGLRFEPTTWASFGADLWSVKIRDRISQLSEEVVMADPAKYLKNFTVFVDPGTKNHYVALYLPNENLGEERYLGLDLDGKLNFNTSIGKLMTSVNWTYMIKYEYQRLKDGEWYTNLGMYNDGAVTFRNIVRASANLKTGPFENTLTANFKSGYRDQPCTAADCGLVRRANANGSAGALVDMTEFMVDSYSTLDWQGRYSVNKNLDVTLGVLNLLDENPPLTLKTSGGHQLGYDNRYTDPRGRTFYAKLNYRF